MRSAHIERPTLRPADGARAGRAAIAPVNAGGEVCGLGGRGAIHKAGHFAAERRALLRDDRHAAAADGAHAPDAAAVEFREPQPPVGAHGDALRAAVVIAADLLSRHHAQSIHARQGEMHRKQAGIRDPQAAIARASDIRGAAAQPGGKNADCAGSGDVAHRASDILILKPQVAVRASGDAGRKSIIRRGEFGQHARRAHAPDQFAGKFREPKIAVGPAGDIESIGGHWVIDFARRIRGREALDEAALIRHPQIVVAADGYTPRTAERLQCKLSDGSGSGSGRGDHSYLANFLGEPEIAIWPGDNFLWRRIRRGNGILRHRTGGRDLADLVGI